MSRSPGRHTGGPGRSQHGFEPRELDRFLKSQLTDSTKSLKWSKASKAGSWYKIGTKPFASLFSPFAGTCGESGSGVGLALTPVAVKVYSVYCEGIRCRF
jgi:hypothetical protein